MKLRDSRTVHPLELMTLVAFQILQNLKIWSKKIVWPGHTLLKIGVAMATVATVLPTSMAAAKLASEVARSAADRDAAVVWGAAGL